MLQVVATIPSGHVMSYGDIAAVLGSRAARAVGTVLARSGGSVPWWRVVRSGGLPPAGHEDAARVHYEREGTPLVATDADAGAGYRVDMAAARWLPPLEPQA